jgi:broad specificity phosphatase PhoE
MDSAARSTLYTITLLRHAQSVGNAEGYHQGQSDFPLTELGCAQAQAVAERWQAEGTRFDQLISSPLLRARQSAEIIAEVLGLEITYDELWMERDNGQLAGLRVEEAAERFPQPDFLHPYQPVGETGETPWELYLRAGRAVSSLLRRPPGSYLVVSHGGLLNQVLYAVLGIAPQANFQGPRFRFRNTAFTVLIYRPENHNWIVDRANDYAHWPDQE